MSSMDAHDRTAPSPDHAALLAQLTGKQNPVPAAQHDPVNHPAHYTSHASGIECIQITEHMSFTVGNAIKYLWRADLKNGIEDLEKARWYVEREIARRQNKQEESAA